jgi:hypothetical protein
MLCHGKIHGTSAHMSFKNNELKFFSGGSDFLTFCSLFNKEELLEKFKAMSLNPETEITVFGESYGGKLQGMKETYGDKLKFVAFEVNINDCWLNVPKAESFVKSLGLDFVHYDKTETSIEKLNQLRDSDSVQAIKNGCGTGHIREGIVLRPLEEMIKNNGCRIISKHKGAKFSETSTPREVGEKTEQLIEAEKIAREWVTLERLKHVIDSFQLELKVENIGKIIKAMTEDIIREAGAEILPSPQSTREIGKITALLVKNSIDTSF